ncbi:MAG TPA: DUF2254 family protein [Thermoleophilia bacterium]|nr:DUF2254 family protein [Thermoleophilia bacterium]
MEARRGGAAYADARSVRKLGRGLRRRRRLRIGVTQLFYVVVGVVLGLLIPRIQIWFTVPAVETGQMLLAVGAGLLTFIGVVFSLLFLVVQFGTTTFTPRLNLFHSSPIVWHAFGFYTGVLVFAFAAAFSATGTDRVTGLIPIVTVALLLASIALFRSLQMRAFSSIQLASTLALVTKRGRQVLDGVYPDRPLDDHGEDAGLPLVSGERREVIWTREPGVLQAIDVPRILRAARHVDATVELVTPFGEMVQPRSPVAIVHGTADPSLDAVVMSAIRTGVDRTFEQDPALAFRVLVDIALRAVSSAINDPTTAAQCLDSIETLLRLLVTRDLDDVEVTGPQGQTRVLLPLPAWHDYVSLAFDELIEMGADHAQVRRRLNGLLRDLLALAPANRRAPLQLRLDHLERLQDDRQGQVATT